MGIFNGLDELTIVGGKEVGSQMRGDVIGAEAENSKLLDEPCLL